MSGTTVLAKEIADALAPHLKDKIVPKRLFTTSEAAEYLGMSTTGVRQLVANNELRAVKLDTSLRFDVKDLALLVDTHKD